MKYTSVKVAKFIRRPNRFIAHVIVDNNEEIVHVKNTGRCREILQEGTAVILEETKNTKRKTKYSIIAGYKGDVLINIDSQIPNMVVFQGIKEGKIKEIHDVTKLSKETVYGNSRFDLYFETKEQSWISNITVLNYIINDFSQKLFEPENYDLAPDSR